MRRIKQLLAYLLCIAMLAGIVPVSAFAEETVSSVADVQSETGSAIDTAIIFSDLHTNKSDYKDSKIKQIFGALKNTGMKFSSVTSAGDAFTVNEDNSINSDNKPYDGYTKTISTSIRTALGDNNIPVNYVWSDHDRYAYQEDGYTKLDKKSYLSYGAGDDGIYGTDDDGNYYIYTLSMGDLSTNDRYNAGFMSNRANNGFTASVEESIRNFTADAAKLKKDRPLLIVSHQPLFARRGDNGYANEWVDAINEVANEMDVAFFFGHNHKYDRPEDYYYAKDSEMPVAQKNNDTTGTKTKINFTHMCAGYMDPSTTGSTSDTTREGTVVVATIYEKSINYKTYNEKGVYTGNYALDVDVPRVFASDNNNDHLEDYTLSGIAVSNVEKNKYFVNDMLDTANMVVTATYVKEGSANIEKTISLWDGNEGTDGYTINAVDMSQPGKKTVTVNYQNMTASFEIEAFGKKFTDFNTGVSAEVYVPGTTGITVVNRGSNDASISAAVSTLVKNYIAYDINLSGYENGQDVTVTLPIPTGVIQPVVYYVSDDGVTVTNMNAVKSADGTTVSFVTNHFSTYLIGENVIEEPVENEVTADGTTYEEKTVYILVDAPENGGKYLITNKTLTNGDLSTDWTDEKGVVLIRDGSNINYEFIEVKEGTITVNDTETYSQGYIEIDNDSAVWEAENNNNNWRFRNGTGNNNYLVLESNELKIGSASNWIYDASNWIYDTTTNRLKNAQNIYLYFTYINTGTNQWKWNTTSSTSGNSTRDIFFYKEVTAKIPSNNQVVYKMQAEDLVHVLDTTVEDYINTQTLSYALLANGEVASNIPTGGAFCFDVFNDANGIINSISNDGTITFNNVIGKANVKVSYTWTDEKGTYTVYKYVEVSTEAPSYEINLHFVTTTVDDNGNLIEYELGEEIVAPIVIKKVDEGQQYKNIWAVISKNGTDIGRLTEEQLQKLSFYTSDESIATVDQNTGVVTFAGETGLVTITVTYEYSEGNAVTDSVVFSVSDDDYYVPEDGTSDFPEYPNEGSVRFDKTATAVGNFSETGITQLELSMTGVPFTTGHRMDVVLMLDNSSSMAKADVDRVGFTKTATEAFISKIVKNEDGTFNNNRIYVAAFMGGNMYYTGTNGTSEILELSTPEDDGYQVINSEQELKQLMDEIDRLYGKNKNSKYGTDYAKSLEDCYNMLTSTKADGNQQFCVFMSDGIPNKYQGEEELFKSTDSSVGGYGSLKPDIISMFVASDNYGQRDADYEYEKYSTMMKDMGVSVYTVGLGLTATNSSWTSSTAESRENVASILLNDISGPAYESVRDTGSAISKLNKYFYNVADQAGAEGLKDVFSNIAQRILEAAKDVKVTDKIADEYTMVFESPNSDVTAHLPASQSFYIEVKDYALIPVYESAGSNTIIDYTRGAAISMMKVYLGKENGDYYAASDENGTRHATPLFTTAPVGTKYYWTTEAAKGDQGIEIVGADDTTYYFVSTGNGTHNMTSGAFASGTPVTKSIKGKEISNTTCEELIIATPYFVYNAATRMLVWTAEKLSSSELALTYFLYLNESGGYVGTDEETEADTYPTNDYADLHYTNFLGNECKQIFPVPQMTWNGAQVSYVFYLVNENGQPVNRAGRVIPFSDAVYVTDINTYSVVWNKNDMEGALEADYLATNLVPDVYELFDDKAEYMISVYEDEAGINKDNHFEIKGERQANTTYVFNTKSDTRKYNVPGYYDKDDVHAGFDFSNTTVAFAVVWKPELVEDVVVIDYGLPVDINVAINDNVAGVVTGVAGDDGSLNSYVINKGQLVSHLFFPNEVSPDPDGYSGIYYGAAKLINETTVRYTPTTMNMNNIEKFFYITTLNYYDTDETLITSRMYSSVTVIPATTVYYEDSFVSYTNSSVEHETYGKWSTEGTEQKAVQATDRPGTSVISKVYDADNIYGYDQAYDDYTQYSLGSAKKVTVHDKTGYGMTGPKAKFTFTGTGFDIISLTDSDSGVIIVEVKNLETGAIIRKSVNNYYGYTYGEMKDEEGNTVTDEAGNSVNGWYVDADASGCVWQVPVLKVDSLDYGEYEVTITVAYANAFDHKGDGSYSFWLDAIRIYDPLLGNKTAENAYVKDGEFRPTYTTVKELLISANSLGELSESKPGVVFIDGKKATSSLEDYANPGPNNETYLAGGQGVSFKLRADAIPSSVQIGVKLAFGDSATLKLNEANFKTVSTATDMYYEIDSLEWNWNSNNRCYESNEIVLSNATDGAVISITNIKHTLSGNSQDPLMIAFVDEETVATGFSLMRMLYMPQMDEEIPEETPVFTPEAATAEWKAGHANKKSELKVKTSTDVAYITVNDVVVTDYKDKQEGPAKPKKKDKKEKVDTREWKYSEVIKEPGTYTYEVVMYDINGIASEPIVTQVTVKK